MIKAKEVFREWYWCKLSKIDRNMASANEEIDNLNDYFSEHMNFLGMSNPPRIIDLRGNLESVSGWTGAKN